MENTENLGGYGFTNDEVKKASLQMGLNSGYKMTKFAHTTTGGKNNDAEMLEILFEKDGGKVYANKFPITKAFDTAPDGQQVEVTDPRHPSMVKARTEMTSTIIHIIKAFVPEDAIRAALATPIQSFGQYCQILQGLLPANFSEFELDIFAHYQWTIKGENTRTFAELPKNMKQGKWITKSIEPKGGAWERKVNPNAANNDVALRYEDGEGNLHLFTRSGWFMGSNFATVQSEEGLENAGAMNAAAPTEGGATVQNSDSPGW